MWSDCPAFTLLLVKIITIDDLDTLIVSKNFGIISFPDFRGKNFILLGVEGKQSAGKRNLYFDDFINPEIGDTFQYIIEAGARFLALREIQKHIVQGIEKNENETSINTRLLSRKTYYDYTWPADTVYSVSQQRLSYSRKELEFLDKHNYQNLGNTNPTIVGFNHNFKSLTKSYNDNAIVIIGDTLYSTFYPYGHDTIKHYLYGTKIGLIQYNVTWNHMGQYSAYYGITLQGYSNGIVTRGKIYDDSYFQKPDVSDSLDVSDSTDVSDRTNISDSTDFLESIHVFPTVFNNEINIAFKDMVMKASIDVCDIQGRVLYKNVITNINNTVIRLEGLSRGMYILRIEINNKKQIPIKIIKG